MKIGIGFSYFDNIKEIPRALDPVAPHVHRIYAIDGRYQYYESDHDHSIDGSTGLIKQRYPNARVEYFSGYQPEKRQKYFDMAGEDGCHWLIGLDTDEYVHPQFQDWDFFLKHLKLAMDYPDQRFFMRLFIPPEYDLAGNIFQIGEFNLSARVYRNPGNIKHAFGSHYLLMPKDAQEEDLLTGKADLIGPERGIIDGVRLMTDSTHRSATTLARRDSWAKKGFDEEKRRLRQFFNEHQALVEGYQRKSIKALLGRPVINIRHK